MFLMHTEMILKNKCFHRILVRMDILLLEIHGINHYVEILINRSKFAVSCVEFIQKYAFDDIELDW
jgi:hypothetical protein